MSTAEQSLDGNYGGENRRDFLYIATGGVGAVGAALAAWPFIDQMNPAADTLAVASIEVDVSAIGAGEAIKVFWRGKPVFIRRRTDAELEQVRAIDVASLPDPQADGERVLTEAEDLLVVEGVCTHFGCIPVGTSPTDDRGDFGGWFCPCHGSHYDASGRIRKGPAPRNLKVPEYAFISDSVIKIG